jgi:signal transduction histidine kinase
VNTARRTVHLLAADVSSTFSGVKGERGEAPIPGDDLRVQLRLQARIAGVLEPEAVLRRIVEAGMELTGAPYAAVGVVAADGSGLQQFVHAGMAPEVVAAIGHLPEGKGLLGALIEDPQPTRLGDLTQDPRAGGFPAGHPELRSLLAAPVRVRDRLHAVLHLAATEPDAFTERHEELAVWLAGVAGTAIDNAWAHDASRRRQRWLQASSDTTLRMLTGTPVEMFESIARSVLDLAGADVVTVVQPTSDRQSLVVEVAVGEGAEELMSSTYPAGGTLSEHVLATASPVVADSTRDPMPEELSVYLRSVVPVGPVMVLPLMGTVPSRPRGVLVVGRLRGKPRFDNDEVEMASAFANHASVALELLEARRDQQRVLLLEDRARIARDLHDHVIQQLFAAGMSLQGLGAGLDEPAAAQVERVVDQVDEAIRQIRSSIFQLTPQRFSGQLRKAVLDAAAEVTPALGYSPDVTFSGPVDLLSDPDLTADVVAVVREALTNVARHAQASSVQVLVAGTPEAMTVTVTDNGVGLGEQGRRSGLENIRRRAERRSGGLAIEDCTPGTRVTWRALVS